MYACDKLIRKKNQNKFLFLQQKTIAAQVHVIMVNVLLQPMVTRVNVIQASVEKTVKKVLFKA